jgi:hypothetical protein
MIWFESRPYCGPERQITSTGGDYFVLLLLGGGIASSTVGGPVSFDGAVTADSLFSTAKEEF